jgi:Mg2+ and Co2+ transporter CorA
MEDFIKELSDISNYVRELHNMMTRDSSISDAVSMPPLSVKIFHTFQQIVKIFVFRSKQLSLINRRRNLASGRPFENIRLIQRIDRKIEELLSLEMDTNERTIELLESAKKDTFLSGIGSHAEMLQAETVRVQFLALAFMSGVQRPLLRSSYIGRSYVRDTLLQLYNDYTSRLHFQANSRPQKRVFLDIHGLEEELQALDKLVESQETSLYNAMTLIDPLTSRYTTETRIREFRAELQYGNDHLRRLIERRREIDNLATRLWILKDQVKQTIEIMEEDHGKAIRVFTVVTLFFLPLSFVSSFLGMNTVDVRNSDYNQRIFWITGIPITVTVLSIAFIYGYKGEEIRDWMIRILQDRGHPYSSSAFGETNKDNGYRTSLETRWTEWNPVTTANQNKRRDFRALIRSKIKKTSDRRLSISENFMRNDGSDGRVLIRRRNTEDSLAPMRRS